MADIDANIAIIIAVISAGSAVIGGLISSGATYLLKRQEIKNEEKKRQEDRDSQEIKLSNEAYVDFLRIKFRDAHPQVGINEDTGEPYYGDFDPDLLEDALALVLTHGSPNVRSLLVKTYPFQNWEEVEAAKRAIMRELVIEKGGKLPLSAMIEEKEIASSSRRQDQTGSGKTPIAALVAVLEMRDKDDKNSKIRCRGLESSS